MEAETEFMKRNGQDVMVKRDEKGQFRKLKLVKGECYLSSINLEPYLGDQTQVKLEDLIPSFLKWLEEHVPRVKILTPKGITYIYIVRRTPKSIKPTEDGRSRE